MTSLKKYFPLLIIIGAAIAVWGLGLHHYLSIESLRLYHQDLHNYVSQNMVFSLVIYVFVYVGVVGLSLPGATFMTLLGGFLFGQVLGTFIVVISATCGATLLFLAVRQASESVLKEKAGEWLKKMQYGFKENAASYLLTLRLIPIFPFVAINLVAAILQIPLRTFFWCTLIGIIPGSFVYVSIGYALRDVIQEPNFTPNLLLKPSLIMGLVGLGILSLLPVFYKAYHKKR